MQVRRRVVPAVGRTGARFPRLPLPDGPSDPAAPDGAEEMAPADSGAVGVTGARFPRPVDVDPPGRPGVPPAGSCAGSTTPRREPEPVTAAIGVDLRVGVGGVRPYVLTRGRTRTAVDIPVEALVTVGPGAARPAGTAPSADLVELCRVPRSVAEVAALSGLPLGVTRVLVGDLAVADVLVVHRTAGASGPDRALLARVLSGLRRL